MCTLSLAIDEGELIFTHNRDESIKRGLAVPPKYIDFENHKWLRPTDPLGGGTWWMTDDQGNCAFILNGGYELHVRTPPYKHSRGLLIPELFKTGNFELFALEYDFEGLEPFTIIGRMSGKLFEIVWTGEKIHSQEIDGSERKIWASSTLYPEKWKSARKEWLNKWEFQDGNSISDALWSFHHASFTSDKEHDMIMQRWGHLKTVAITQFREKDGNWQVRYEDLITNDLLEFKG